MVPFPPNSRGVPSITLQLEFANENWYTYGPAVCLHENGDPDRARGHFASEIGVLSTDFLSILCCFRERRKPTSPGHQKVWGAAPWCCSWGGDTGTGEEKYLGSKIRSTAAETGVFGPRIAENPLGRVVREESPATAPPRATTNPGWYGK